MKSIYTPIFLLLAFCMVLLVNSCKDDEMVDPCATQYCLNGGDCLEGVCICPSGWTGEHCDVSTTPTAYRCASGTCVTDENGQYASLSACQSACGNGGGNEGYNCINGDCQYSSTNGQYATLTACNSNCSGNSSAGYNCVNGNCQYVNSNGQYSSLTSCQSNCGSNQTTLSFKNNGFTDMSITINGLTKTITPGNSQTFTGTPGNSATGSASTSGRTSQGATVGLTLNWDLAYNFPSSGISSVNLNVSSDYFFLKIRNQGSRSLINLYVNYDLNSQTLDNISLPNNGTIYNIGYYRAWTNGNVRADLQGTNTYVYWNHGSNYTLPFTNNQSVVLTNNTFREEEALEKG